MRTINLLFFTAMVAGATSCTKKSVNTGPIDLPGNAVAYVAATLGDTAAYFVNGKEYALTTGNTPASANAIALSGSDVYVAGWDSIGTHQIATYWTKGTTNYLFDTTANSNATSIAVTGDVYVAGWIYNGPAKNAALWRNGKLSLLTPTGHGGCANAIVINGSDVYVAGYDSTAGQVSACYWKNGTQTLLPDSLPYAMATGIAVSGSDIYLAGWDRTADGYSHTGPRYWHNGLAMPLPASYSYYAIATAITVVNGATYIAGVDYYQSVYWENGIEKPVSDSYSANGIAVNNGDIYVAGTSSGSAGYNSPTFWRNGIGFILDKTPGSANAIIVTN